MHDKINKKIIVAIFSKMYFFGFGCVFVAFCRRRDARQISVCGSRRCSDGKIKILYFLVGFRSFIFYIFKWFGRFAGRLVEASGKKQRKQKKRTE